MTLAEDDRSDRLLLDTHTFLWMVEAHSRLGARTVKMLNQAARKDQITVSAITPWEIALLVSKKRIDLQKDVMEWIREALSKPGVRLAALEPEIAVESTRLPFEMHPDPADRILVATARHLGAKLVTADRALLEIARKGNFRAMDAGI